MEIRDVIHGSIKIEKHELAVVDSPYFQRLREIKQLGFSEYSFPGATHNRYMHSLGCMKTATLAFDTIFGSPCAHTDPNLPGQALPKLTCPSDGSFHLVAHAPEALIRFRAVTRLAALLHDIGHGPLSHTTEFAMPDVRDLKIPALPGETPRKARKATHEDYTIKILLDSSLTPELDRAGKAFGFGARHVAALIEPSLPVTDDFFREAVCGQGIDFRPVLQQLISSELDADRMDYLRRDSLHVGVSYGEFDFDWIIGNLVCHVQDGKCYLCLQHRALYSFEDFLISRFHMFLMVYFHHKSIVYDSMLAQYLSSPECDYSLPADMEQYRKCTDNHLLSHLAESKNEWARRIVEKRPYRMLVELHSGIPATKLAAVEQKRLIEKMKQELAGKNIHFLTATSTGQLSKYFRAPGDPIYVRYDNHYNAPSFIPLQKCTDLFQRYNENRSITRIYVSPERYADCRDTGRGAPLRYEEDGV